MNIIWEWNNGNIDNIKVVDERTPFKDFGDLYFYSEQTYSHLKKSEISNCINKGVLPVNWYHHPMFFCTGAAKMVTIIMDIDDDEI